MKPTVKKAIYFVALVLGVLIIYSLLTTPFSEIKQGFLDGFYGRQEATLQKTINLKNMKKQTSTQIFANNKQVKLIVTIVLAFFFIYQAGFAIGKAYYYFTH